MLLSFLPVLPIPSTSRHAPSAPDQAQPRHLDTMRSTYPDTDTPRQSRRETASTQHPQRESDGKQQTRRRRENPSTQPSDQPTKPGRSRRRYQPTGPKSSSPARLQIDGERNGEREKGGEGEERRSSPGTIRPPPS